jgi:hypothetical protein
MRRLIILAATVAALAAALAVGPLGAAAAAPYLYACDPGGPKAGGGNEILYLYNCQAGTATVTVRTLTASGIDLGLVASPQSIVTGTTKVLVFTAPGGLNSSFTYDPQNVNTTIATIRVVSDKALGVGVHLSNNEPTVLCPLIVV